MRISEYMNSFLGDQQHFSSCLIRPMSSYKQDWKLRLKILFLIELF